MLDRAMVSWLECPSCRNGGLEADCTEEGERLIDGVLRCDSCRAEFFVESGIPHLKPGSQCDVTLKAGDDNTIKDIPSLKPTSPQEGEAWATWRNHLDGFAARRTLRASAPSRQRDERWRHKLQAFADFVNAPNGRLLDVGCGPGKLRELLDPQRVTYHGLDPLPVEDVEAFPFVCALAEKMPFRAGTFSSLVVRSALDHFCDLDAFFEEAARVLTDDGQIFIEQAVHDGRGMSGLVKNTVHAARDLFDDLRTRNERKDAPKHMRDFSRDSLMQATQRHFEVDRFDDYNPNWYTATQVFISLRCHRRVSRTADTAHALDR